MIIFLYSFIGILAVLLLGSYIVYPFLLNIFPVRKSTPVIFPQSTVIHLIVPCYNEENVLRRKVENSLSVDYPFPVKVHIVIDQSSDRTYQIAQELAEQFPNVKVWNKGYRKGKNDSINYVIRHVEPQEHDILFFTDSNTFFEKGSFQALYDEFLGGSAVVGGSMVYRDMRSSSAQSEGLYWKYEEWIREKESRVGRLIAMNGGVIAMVAKYFMPVPNHVPNDFEAPLRLVSSHRSTFAKEAKGIEEAIQDNTEEYCRKQRMANRQMSAVLLLWKGMSPLTKFQVTFHKVIRWFGLHLFLLQCGLVFLACFFKTDYFNLLLSVIHGSILVVMCLALIDKDRSGNRLLSIAYHAMAVHYNAFKGASSAIFGKKASLWDKAESNR